MTNQQTIVCAFCQGTGNNPHFRGTCPACKGRGKNEVVGKYMTCSSCRGSGQKKGTILTCYDCRGLGVLPDTRETFMRAREEIKEAQEEMARERSVRQWSARPPANSLAGEVGREPHLPDMLRKSKRAGVLVGEAELSEKTHFCQCCGSEVNENISIKICLTCFTKLKKI